MKFNYWPPAPLLQLRLLVLLFAIICSLWCSVILLRVVPSTVNNDGIDLPNMHLEEPISYKYAQSTQPPIIAKWTFCTQIQTVDNAQLIKERDKVVRMAGTLTQRKAAGCGRFCNGKLQYISDRCARPRATCILQPRATSNGTHYGLILSSSLHHTEKYASGEPLRAGQYVALLGAANAIGTMSHTPFDELIEGKGIITTVNLGRGGASPKWFTDHWEALESIVVNAAAVVVSAMAIRSSDNDACPEERCTVKQRFNLWKNSSKDERKLQEEQSFESAMQDYHNLIEAIHSSTNRLQLEHPPKIILLWHSQCKLSTGCKLPGYFPQWYTTKDRVDRLVGIKGWDTIVDGSFSHYKDMSSVFSIDKCEMGCRNAVRNESIAEKVCILPKFRQDVKKNGGCSHECEQVVNIYYPMHGAVAAQKLLPVLKGAMEERKKTRYGIAS